MRRQLYDAEHDAYRSSVRAYLEKEVVPNFADWEKAGITSRDIFTGLGELGTLGFGIPEEYGGTGVTDFRFNAILSEEAAALGVVAATMGVGLQADICVPYFVELCTDEQKAKWLPGIATGELITAIAMTEPGTGSDLSGIRTRATLEDDHYVLDGAKTFISNGINADLVIVAVRTGEHPHQGISLIVVERDTPGFERGRNLEKLGLHAQDTAELSFTACRVPAANLLGAEGEGFFAMTRNLAQERLAGSASAVAQSQAALDWTIEYVRERKAFGKPIGALQNTRFKLAELATEIDIARQYVDRCIQEHNIGELTVVDAAKAKWWSTELQGRVMDTCLQLFGGYGYMTEYPIARAWADARITRIFAGTTEIMKEIIGRSLPLQ
jgi:alkylation response protein AidB-like acyl-CoA dehydrogenase